MVRRVFPFWDVPKVIRKSGDDFNRDVPKVNVQLESSVTFKGMYLTGIFPK